MKIQNTFLSLTAIVAIASYAKMKRTFRNLAACTVMAGSLVANAQNQSKINLYLVPESTQLLPGQSSYLDVIVDNRPLTSNTSLTPGEMTTLGADISVIEPQYITFTGAQFPVITSDFFKDPKTGQLYDMLQGYNFLGEVTKDRLKSTRLTDFFTHNERDISGNMIYGPFDKQGVFERISFVVNDSAPVGYNAYFSLDENHTAFTNGAANEQPYQVISSPITFIPEPSTLIVLGLGAAGALATRTERKKINFNNV